MKSRSDRFASIVALALIGCGGAPSTIDPEAETRTGIPGSSDALTVTDAGSPAEDGSGIVFKDGGTDGEGPDAPSSHDASQEAEAGGDTDASTTDASKPEACTPLDFSTACAGKECGDAPNGCGGVYACATCTQPTQGSNIVVQCIDNHCNGATQATCEKQNKNCGTLTIGGDSVTCDYPIGSGAWDALNGSCAPGETCGGITLNVCTSNCLEAGLATQCGTKGLAFQTTWTVRKSCTAPYRITAGAFEFRPNGIAGCVSESFGPSAGDSYWCCP